MASFRTHICFGVAGGVLGVIGLIGSASLNEPGLLALVFSLVTLGSVLPDMDSDSGIPFHVAFGALSIVSGVMAFISIYKKAPGSWQTLILTTIGTLVFVWGVIGYIFKKLTQHRGIVHSIPSALLAGLITFFISSRLLFSDLDSFILGVAIFTGYIIHLVLDEIYAAVNFHGSSHLPNKAFGSALKLKSHNKYINLLVYSIIIFLLAGNTQRIISLSETFWVNVVRH